VQKKKIIWGLSAIALVALLALVGFTVLWPRNAQPDPSTYGIRVNGAIISQADLDEVTQSLIQVYRDLYVQGGGDFDQLLSGPAGAYYQLQLQYQASQRLIERILIRQEAQRRGLRVAPEELEAAFQERYQQFLQENGMTEADLHGLFQDPAKKRLTQRLLGLREESVDALKARFRREAEERLLESHLVESLLGKGASLEADADKKRWRAWLDQVKAQSTIVFSHPLLNAYHLERRVDQAKTTEEKLRYLDEAIASYEKIRIPGIPDANLEYFLAQLYNLRVNWSLQLEGELQAQAQNGQAVQQKLSSLQQQIVSNREKATQFFLSADVNDEQQLQALTMGDPSNPFYSYLYARYLLTQEEVARALRWVRRALELDPAYIEAHLLLGDINVFREHYREAIDAYAQALKLSKEWEASGQPFKTADSRPIVVQRKLAEAYLGLAHQLEQYPQEGSLEVLQSAISQADVLLIELLQALREDDPAYPVALAHAGDVEFLRKNYRAAQERYQKSLTYVNDKAVRVKLGRAYLLNRQLPEAERTFRAILTEDPKWATAHLGLAGVHLVQNQRREAMRQYKLAFAKSGDELTYPERRRIALDALKLDPNDAEMHQMLADFYLEHHAYQAAVDEYQIVLRLQPTSVAAYKGLGKASLGRFEFDLAFEQFQRALQQSPPISEQLEIYQLILQTARKAAGPGNPLGERGQDALYQLASLYLSTGELDKSRNALSELREQYPDYRTREAQRLLQQLARIVGDTLPGSPVPDQGRRIIAPGETHPPYNSVPPTSGWHYAIPARWGIHESPIPDEVQLRNLAGGGVLIQYRPDLAEAELQSLRAFVAELRKEGRYCRLILAPYERLDRGIVLTAWNRIDRLAGFDPEQVMVFIDAFLGQGPEVSEVSCR
jgi:tetratricopeptide (TPR) repeat protein